MQGDDVLEAAQEEQSPQSKSKTTLPPLHNRKNLRQPTLFEQEQPFRS
jgi:hypothetical protein